MKALKDSKLARGAEKRMSVPGLVRAGIVAVLTAACGHHRATEFVVGATELHLAANAAPTSTQHRISSLDYDLSSIAPRPTNALFDQKRHALLFPMLQTALRGFDLTRYQVRTALVDNYYLVERPVRRRHLGEYYPGDSEHDLITISPETVATEDTRVITHEIGHDLWLHAVSERRRAQFRTTMRNLIADDYLIGADSMPESMYYAALFRMYVDDYIDAYPAEVNRTVAAVPGSDKVAVEGLLAWYLHFLFYNNSRFYGGYHHVHGTTFESAWRGFVDYEIFPCLLEDREGIPAFGRFYDSLLSVSGQHDFYSRYAMVEDGNVFLLSLSNLQAAIPLIRSFMKFAIPRVGVHLQDRGLRFQHGE